MRLHWKRAPMLHKDGHHPMKRKLFKKIMLRSMFNDDDMSCKKKHFKKMMKRGLMMGPGHHGKRHFKGHSSSDSDDSHHGKRKHFKHMMKHHSPGRHGKFKHFRGSPGYSSSSSDSDDNEEHHGKRKHFMGKDRHHGMRKHFMDMKDGHHGMRKHFMEMKDGHHGMRKHFMDMHGPHHGTRKHFMDMEESHHGIRKHFMGMHGPHRHHGMRKHFMIDMDGPHHGERKHFMAMGRRCRSMSPFGDHHGHKFKGFQGRSTTCSRDGRQGTETGCVTTTEKNRNSDDTQGQSTSHVEDVQQSKETVNEARQNSTDIQGQPMETKSTEKGHHTSGIAGPSMPLSDDEDLQRQYMSENGKKDRKKMCKRGGCMTDLEDGHHGRGRHFRGMRRGHRFRDNDRGHNHGMMHHFKRKHWMKGHDKSGFFGEDSALVPICTIDDENPLQTFENETAINQGGDAAETGIKDSATARDQSTQTTGIMEIVIEDQEALHAAISIANKFL